MSLSPPHLKPLEKIERNSLPSPVAVLCEESIEAVRYAFFIRPTGTETTTLHLEKPSHRGAEAHRLRIDEAVDTLSQGSEGFYDEVLRPS